MQRLYSRFRQPDESVSAFVAELKHLAKDCDFGAALEDNLRDRLVCGISDHSLQKILLSEQKLKFKRAFEIAISLAADPRILLCYKHLVLRTFIN